MTTIDAITARHVKLEGTTMEPDGAGGMRVAAWCGSDRCEFATWPCDAAVLLARVTELEGALREVAALACADHCATDRNSAPEDHDQWHQRVIALLTDAKPEVTE